MFAWKNKTCDIPQGETALPKLDARTTGLVAGTKVATTAGWAKVETITEGQKVLTFDGGLQAVVAITCHVLMTDTTEILSWPLLVPCGALWCLWQSRRHEHLATPIHHGRKRRCRRAERRPLCDHSCCDVCGVSRHHIRSLARWGRGHSAAFRSRRDRVRQRWRVVLVPRPRKFDVGHGVSHLRSFGDGCRRRPRGFTDVRRRGPPRVVRSNTNLSSHGRAAPAQSCRRG